MDIYSKGNFTINSVVVGTTSIDFFAISIYCFSMFFKPIPVDCGLMRSCRLLETMIFLFFSSMLIFM